MTRDEAIKIAAACEGWTPHSSDWASNVVDRADALLAAMEPAPNVPMSKTCEHLYDTNYCAATEARVVAEIVAWLRSRFGRETAASAVARQIERGDWRAKGER